MRNNLLKMNEFFEKLPDKVRKHPVLIWLLFISITGCAFVGVPKLKIDMSWDALFQSDEPAKVAYDRFRGVFGSDEIMYIVYEAKDGNVFSRKSLETLKKLQNELETKIQNSIKDKSQFSHITDITSLINVSYLEGDSTSLISRDFIGNNIPQTLSESIELRDLALNHPDYPKLYCSDDGHFGGIILRTNFNAEIIQEMNQISTQGTEEFNFGENFSETYTSPLDGNIPKFKGAWIKDYIPFRNDIYKIIQKDEYTEFLTFHPVGNTELMGFLGIELQKEMAIIILGSLLLILNVLGFLFRSAKVVLWAFLIIVSTLVWTLGTIGWSGLSMTDFINIIVFLLIAVGVADAVHILSGYVYFRRNGNNHDNSLKYVYKKSGFACFLTSLTTAAGLLALNFAPIIAIQRLSIFAALGVMFAFIITVVMLPLMLDIIRPKINIEETTTIKKEGFIQKLLSRFYNISTRYSKKVIIAFIAIACVFIPGIFMLQIDSNMVTIIREDTPLRKNFAVVDENMAGTGNIEILVDTGIPDGIKDFQVIKKIEAFQNELKSKFKDIVYKTVSIVNVTRDSYKVLNENQENMYLIPEDPDELAQTLFLFSTANPKDRRLLVTDDFRAARIIVNTRNIGSQEGLHFMYQVNPVIDKHFNNLKIKYNNLRIETTGQIPMFLRMMDLISWSQIQSFGISLLIISIIMFLLLSKVRSGLIAIIPNLFPIMTVFGIMGWLGIPLDVHTLLVVPIIIGISVDDTIHFVTNFHIEMKKQNNVFTAISYTIKEAGQAIIFTSVVLAIGYLVFLFCVNKGFAYFGFLSSIAVLTALLSDLLLLPALLSIQKKKDV